MSQTEVIKAFVAMSLSMPTMFSMARRCCQPSVLPVFDDSGNPDQELPPLPFRYTPFEPQGRKFLLTTSADLPAERPIERRLQEV